MPLLEDPILARHFGGATLTEIAEAEGVRSPETARKRLAEAQRAHLLDVAGELLLARRTHEVLWFLVPTADPDDLSAGLAYFSWIVRQLGDHAVRCRIHAVEKPDGLALGIEEVTDAEEAQA